MSFFSSLQQYVTSGVAGLGLSARRFSRGDSTDGFGNQIADKAFSASGGGTQLLVGQASTTGINFQSGNSTPSLGSMGGIGTTVTHSPLSTSPHVHGFPKVIPPPGTSPTQCFNARRQSSRGAECIIPPRTGSFRQRNSPVHKASQDKPPLAFCKRRLSWPEVDSRCTSGVQETDGSYFESFTALAWKRENRRMSAMRKAENKAETAFDSERDKNKEFLVHLEDKEKLYIEVLHTIANSVGAPAPGGQYSHYKEEMYLHAQRAFDITPEKHYQLLNNAAEEKLKKIVLSVIVIEAEGLEAKDANGFSDPYCMLGIQPSESGPPISPLPSTARNLSSDMSGFEITDSPNHRKHSFRLSFKRKEGGTRREQRDSLSGPVPAKFIRATSIKTHTLCPKWNEKFKFDIEDINTDIFHLDIWDHDDETCVIDAVSRLNEVRGVRGLGRFFKQVCQSARQGSQDDFLGAVNIPIIDIPSTGLEGWFKLEARSQRSTVQGRIRLRLWLSTREDQGTSDEANSSEINKIEKLHFVFMQHEIKTHEPSWTWCGELPGPALTILHQMAVQGDLTDLQSSLSRFIAVIRLNYITPIDPKYVHKLLIEIDKSWNQPNNEILSIELQQRIADAMTSFIDKSLEQIRKHREIFPALHSPSLVRLEFLLRCLGLLGSMKAFRQVCPFNKGIRGEIVGALRKGSIQWAHSHLRDSQHSTNPLVNFTTIVIADIQMGLTYYHSYFDATNGIQYFSIIYKQFDAMLAEELILRMEKGHIPGLGKISNQLTSTDNNKESADTRPFELYLALQEFSSYKQNLSCQPQPPEKPLALQNYFEWFISVLEKWMILSKTKALQRVRASIQLDQICEGERIVRHSTSSVDTASCFYQMKEFWKMLQWPDLNTSSYFEAQLIDAACSAAMHYCDLIHQILADSGYYEQQGPFRISDDMCVTVNNLEYVRRALSEFRSDSQLLHENTETLLESSLSQLETRTERILSKLCPLMQISLQKAVFHLAWSPESLPTNQAIVPLLEYLDNHLSALNSALLTKNFNRALNLIWNAVLSELTRQMDTGADDRPINFHDRLHEALQLLVEFFNADGLGLALDHLHSDSFWRVEQRLQYHKTETEKLIDLFYLQRLQEQLIAAFPGSYGSLAVRAYFNHDSLCVEVLHAKDILPLDPNGFSDPFVILELLPRRVFNHCNEQQTNVHKKTLNPVFDECFEFSVTLDQCLKEDAMVAFTVMDHDVLTSNDFAGEAFLALGTIPGVADYSTSVDNFHGLKPVELPLLQQQDKNHPILQILESRITDKLAIEFVRKQKTRLST